MQSIDREQLRQVTGGFDLGGLTGMMGAAGPMLGGIAQIIAACKSGKGGDAGAQQAPQGGDPQAAAAAAAQQGPAGAGAQVAAAASMQMGPPPPRHRSVQVETGSL